MQVCTQVYQKFRVKKFWEVFEKDANNLIATASKLEVTWTWRRKAAKIMSSNGETRLHFEGVLDKHGKRFFEVGLLMFGSLITY